METREIKLLVNYVADFEGSAFMLQAGHTYTLPKNFCDKLIYRDIAVCVKSPMPSQAYQNAISAGLDKK